MLSLLIPGQTTLGNNIDVYLQPLIDESQELWEREVDPMHTTILWTINDFPRYANLSR